MTIPSGRGRNGDLSITIILLKSESTLHLSRSISPSINQDSKQTVFPKSQGDPKKGATCRISPPLLAPTESPKRFPNRSFPRRCRGSPRSCCLSNVCRRPLPRSRLPVRVAASPPRQVKATQEAGKPGAGALVLALIYGKRALLLSPKRTYHWLMDLPMQVEGKRAVGSSSIPGA